MRVLILTVLCSVLVGWTVWNWIIEPTVTQTAARMEQLHKALDRK